MSDRITKANLDARVENVNRRMEQAGSPYRYAVQGRSGSTAIDRIRVSDGATVDLVRIGTKGEMGEFLHAMMVALDDALYLRAS